MEQHRFSLLPVASFRTSLADSGNELKSGRSGLGHLCICALRDGGLMADKFTEPIGDTAMHGLGKVTEGQEVFIGFPVHALGSQLAVEIQKQCLEPIG